jgi:hypothetical protein
VLLRRGGSPLCQVYRLDCHTPGPRRLPGRYRWSPLCVSRDPPPKCRSFGLAAGRRQLRGVAKIRRVSTVRSYRLATSTVDCASARILNLGVWARASRDIDE